MEIVLHAFLSSAVDGCDWSVYNPAGVLQGGIPRTNIIGSWVEHWTCQDCVEKVKCTQFTLEQAMKA